LNELLCSDGWESKLFEQSEPEKAVSWGKVVILPVKGVSPDNFTSFLNEDQVLITGKDFLSRNDFAVLNAIPTALAIGR